MIELLSYPGQATTMLGMLKYPDDFSKATIVYGWKQSLTPFTKIDDDAIFRAAAAGAGKVSLDKIPWLFPQMLNKAIDQKLSYR